MRISELLRTAKKQGCCRKADAWKNLPDGWTADSRKKFWDSLGGTVTKCMEKMKGKVDDTGAFCGSLGRAVGVDQ